MQAFWFLTKWRYFLMFYCVSNCFKRYYLSFCLHWVATCNCATVRNIKILTIMLEVEGEMEEVWSMRSLPRNEFLDPILEQEDLIKGLKAVWFVINNFLVSFEISRGSYNLSQNTLRLITKYILSFMESLNADFILRWKEFRLTNKKDLKVFFDRFLNLCF